MTKGLLYLEKKPPVAWMYFNRPEKRNSVNLAMWQLMPELIRDVSDDTSIRVLIVRGAGEKCFISGADISQFKKVEFGIANKSYEHSIGKALTALTELKKPVIAMIHGYCMGGGCSVALMCDLRIASDDSRFGIPAAKLGIAYSARGTKRLFNIIGPAASVEMLITGRVLDAKEAYNKGLIHHVISKKELESFTTKYALKISQNAPLSMAAHKAAINEMIKPAQFRNMDKIKEMSMRCLSSEDYAEGIAAFSEKRKPLFRGK